ncbi:MAG: type III pantothenate kinase [Lachnospiraceae bacterium]|nr:type III pantothenate kinase [Lachnospiraceae bacterium]
MILAIDVGNTHITFGCLNEKNQAQPVVRIPTDLKETEFGYAVKMKEILELSGVDENEFDGAIISSVVPPITEMMKRAVGLITDLEPLVVGPGLKSGIKIELDDPGTLAADLIATAVAAKYEYPLPCVIIDMGTATTITVVSAAGSYIGGAILPGVGTSLNALTKGTSLLPSIEIQPPRKAISKQTADAMKSGLIYGNAGSIDGILDQFEKEIGKPATIVSTGGLGRVVCPYCRHEISYDPQLLLKGLGIIWKKNSKIQKRRSEN